MTQCPRDDCPEAFSLSRRNLMVGAALFVGGVLVSPDLSAQTLADLPPDLSKRFMDVSSLLIDHHLDPQVGERMAAAMLRLHPTIDQDISAIIDIAVKKNAKVVEDFFEDIPEGQLKDSALAIIAAWYTGVVENSSTAEVFAFETALMYQPTHDIMTIPSYAISGPNGWNAQAPPLDTMPVF